MRRAQRTVRAVGVTEQEDRLLDGLEQSDQVVNLVLDAVTLGRVGLATPAPRDGAGREVLAESRLDEFPVGVVIAEGAVRQHEKRAAAARFVRDGYPVWA